MSATVLMLHTLARAGWGNASTGDVAAPTGYVTLIDLSTERETMREQVLETAEQCQVLAATKPGWYLLTESTEGLEYQGPMSKAEGDRVLADIRQYYETWSEGSVPV